MKDLLQERGITSTLGNYPRSRVQAWLCRYARIWELMGCLDWVVVVDTPSRMKLLRNYVVLICSAYLDSAMNLLVNKKLEVKGSAKYIGFA